MAISSRRRALRATTALTRAVQPAACETLESRVLLSANAPLTLASDTLVYYETAGTGDSNPPNIVRLAFASSGNAVTIQDLEDTGSTPGTYSYLPIGSTGTVIVNDPDGSHTLSLSFSTATAGSGHLINSDGTEDGAFFLLVNPLPSYAPAAIAGGTLVFAAAAAGGSIFTSTANYQILPAASGNAFSLQPISGSIGSAVGTYTYVPADGVESSIAYVDTTDNITADIFLAFTSTTAGYFYNTDANANNNLSDFQAGTFTFSPTAAPAITSAAVTSSLNPAVENTSVTLTATITPSSAGGQNATGSVTFKDGSTTLGVANLDDTGHASLTTSSLAVGKHSITIVYAGDTHFAGSTSPAITQAVVHSHDTNVSYVSQIYLDVFKRAADSAGLAYWVGLLDSGADTFADFATAVTSSREYDGDVVDAFYVQYLGRHTDSAGLTYWVNKMQSGLNAEVIRAGLLGSDEYYADTGGTNTTFVTALYSSFLGRAPDNSGLSYWLGKLATQTRTQVSSSISNSDENRTDIVTGFYETYLDRAPDPSGLTYWKTKLANGITQPQIVTFFVTLQEYLTLHGLS